MNEHYQLQDRKAIKFTEHPDGRCCEKCIWLEVHKNSLRRHYDYFCRALPVPARIQYEPADYWCGQFKEKENG